MSGRRRASAAARARQEPPSRPPHAPTARTDVRAPGIAGGRARTAVARRGARAEEDCHHNGQNPSGATRARRCPRAVTGVATGRRYTARPCVLTRSFLRWPVVTPSACTPSTCATACATSASTRTSSTGASRPTSQHEGRSVTELGRAGRDRWLLYQSSIGSPVYDILAARPEPKLVNYHNITPAHLLREWEPNVGYEVALGRTQLARLAPQSRLAVADSAFNESELRDLGYGDTAVVPLLIDMHQQERRGRPACWPPPGRRKAATGGADLLFVGKVSPHKAPARSGQDAGRPAPALRSGSTPAPGGLTAGRDLRAGTARLHRRARARRRRQLRRFGHAGPNSRPTCSRRTCSSAPRTTKASACRWPRPWDTGSRSSPTA